MEYTIVSGAICDGSLVKLVNEHIENGWVPLGGLAIGSPFHQAMIRNHNKAYSVPPTPTAPSFPSAPMRN